MARSIEIDERALGEELRRVGDIADRVRLAGFGLAQPLLRMRRGQLEREVARVKSRRGDDHPDVARAEAAAAAANRQTARFDAELGRARVDRPSPKDDVGAGISGLVVRSGIPIEGVTVTAWAGAERADFACTDRYGGFVLDVPSAKEVTLSVRDAAGAELYRDSSTETLQAGQQRFREIDLDLAGRPCPEPDDGRPPEPERFKLVSVVGQTEPDALALLRTQGLQVGDLARQRNAEFAGRVLVQKPRAGTLVQRGDHVDLVVGEDDTVTVPDLVGLPMDNVPVVLKRARLQLGEARPVPVPGAKEGVVTAQRPAAGSRASEGDKVDVEFGARSVPRAGSPPVVRVATLAEERLRAQGIGADEPVGHIERRLVDSGIVDEESLEAVLGEDHKLVRERLGLRTLAETSKVVAALRRARKDLKG